jgi:hypothetical protein
MCANLCRTRANVVIVVDLQWHWLPVEHCADGAWFAPDALSNVVDRIVNTKPYDSFECFCRTLGDDLPHVSVHLYEESAKAEEIKERMQAACGALYVRGLNRRIDWRKVATPSGALFSLNAENLFCSEANDDAIEAHKKACNTMIEASLTEGYVNAVTSLERMVKEKARLSDAEFATVVAQVCNTSGTAWDGNQRNLLRSARDVLGAAVDNMSAAAALFSLACHESEKNAWQQWTHFDKLPEETDTFVRPLLMPTRKAPEKEANLRTHLTRKQCYTVPKGAHKRQGNSVSEPLSSAALVDDSAASDLCTTTKRRKKNE